VTKEEFFAELAQIDGWECCQGGFVRKYHRNERGLICHTDCPVTAVANKRLGRNEWNHNWHSYAADYLGLRENDHRDIVYHADFGGDEELLAACGLKG
jgi:hypothetical protein